MYRIEYTKTALKELKKLPRDLSKRIQAKLELVAFDPYGHHFMVKKLQGMEGYRLRIGDWRVIYSIQDDKLILLVIKLGSRGSVYQ